VEALGITLVVALYGVGLAIMIYGIVKFYQSRMEDLEAWREYSQEAGLPVRQDEFIPVGFGQKWKIRKQIEEERNALPR
jgi:hypothetical protein